MKNNIITLAVLAEARIDENRVPFSPTQISYLLNKFSNLKIIVQPSKRRCFKDKDYLMFILSFLNIRKSLLLFILVIKFVYLSYIN